MKLSLFSRFLIAAVIFAGYIVALVGFNLLDGLIRSFPVGAYLVAIALGAVAFGILKGRLPGKKVVEYSKDNFNKQKQSILGYWTWIFIGAAFFTIWIPIYAAEM